MGENCTRRSFIKRAGATAVGAAMLGSLTACGNSGMKNLTADSSVAENSTAEGNEFYCTCGWSCSFCQYRIFTREGNVAHMLPKPDFDYVTCLKGRSRIQRTYSDARVQYPMKRVEGTARGAGEWERITWDEAISEISKKWLEVEEKYGPLANSYYQGGGGFQGSLNGNAGMIMRLFNATGCTKWDYSFDNATNTGLTRGGIQWFDQNEPKDFVNSDYILFFGGNPINAQIQMSKHLFDAQEAGAKIVVVDPHFSPTAAKADKWIPVKPGCDAALYLGIIKRFMDEGTYKADFVLNHTCAPYLIKKSDGMYLRGGEYQNEPLHVGPPFWVTGLPTEIDPIMVWDEKEGKPACFDTCQNPAWSCPDENYITAWDMFKDHVQEWTLDKVMEVTGISEEDFDFLYNVLQPENKVAHYINFGTGAYENGLQAAYAMTAMIAMTGNFGEPGRSVGGFDCMYGNFFGHALTAPSNGKMCKAVTWLAACDIVSSGKLQGEDYPVKTLWVSHGGLIGGSVNSERNKREMLDKMEMIVVQDPFLTDTARYADYVLPVCDMYEFEDVIPLNHERNVRISEKCIEPMYEAKTDSEIARLFGEAMGLADAVCDVTDDDWWKGTFDDVPAAVEHGITLDTLRKNKLMRYVDEEPYIGNRDYKNFITETGRLMFYVDNPTPRTPSNFDVASVTEREKMPTYFENKISGENSEYAEEFPLVCMSWRNPSRVHMTHFMKDWARDVMPTPTLFVNPEDAAKYGVEEGQDLLITSTVGQCVMQCAFHPGIRPGSTVYYKGYSETESKLGSQGAITTDYADAYAVNCSFFDNRIKIEPWKN
ncbi:MAG: molybdopterin-dependent oxidoreductase [Eggerthellaceae bacterium]|nr:molybdopterin-dependent oxidoreductase [Eggerthellaceae bacterium]